MSKTFIENVILDIIRSQKQIALLIIASGIAASLLYNSIIAYLWFKIPLNINKIIYYIILKRDKIAGFYLKS